MLLNFDQWIQPLGKTQLVGRTAALAVFDALTGMAQRCDSAKEELVFRREAYDLTIDPAHTESSFAGEKRAPVDEDVQTPEWLVTREDFLVDYPQMDKFLELYNAFKCVAADIAAELVFAPPKLPMNEHDSCYIVAKELPTGYQYSARVRGV